MSQKCWCASIRIRQPDIEPEELKFVDQWWVLVKITVADPSGPHDEVHNSRPTHARRAIRVNLEVGFLIVFQVRRSQLLGHAFVLDRLLTSAPPTDDKGT